MACHLDPAMPKAVLGPNEYWYHPMTRSAYCMTHDIQKYSMCLHPRTRLTPEDAHDDENDDNGGADALFHGIAADPQVYWSFYLRLICE